jgi:hypothetical protein
MPSLFRMLTYGVMIVLLLITVMGGFGALMPAIFNLNTDLMFVMLPLTTVVIVAVSISLIRWIVRMIRTDIAKFNKE